MDFINKQVTQKTKQPFDYYCILDLEGKVEILELPILLYDVSQKKVTDVFHHYIHPTKMENQHIKDYIKGKYGSMNLEEEWWKNPIKFETALTKVDEWLLKNDLQFSKNPKGKSFAFITCGNWDIKTQIPNQCQISEISIPDHFGSWINIKEVYNKFYKKSITGMAGMLGQLHIKLKGTHHSGIDDVMNISTIVTRMIDDGAVFDITGRRDVSLVYKKPDYVEFKKREQQPKKNLKLCRFYVMGNCVKGKDCQNSHSSQ
jgi:ERI1 exoribonuclease 3